MKMTPDEWREKHKCCANCVYFRQCYCKVKSRTMNDKLRRFCKIYKAKKFDYSEVKE